MAAGIVARGSKISMVLNSGNTRSCTTISGKASDNPTNLSNTSFNLNGARNILGSEPSNSLFVTATNVFVADCGNEDYSITY